jgi:hypothetical protein
MYSNAADCSSSRDGRLRRLTSSCVGVAKNVSATALSWASPREPIEIAMPACRGARPKARLTYRLPWSEWWISPGPGTPVGERHLERVDDQAGAHVGGHRPADDLTRVGVLHRGELEPPFSAAQIGDVRDPQHVRTGGPKSRSTRSLAGSTPGTRIVVRRRLRGLTPAIPAAFIKRATRSSLDPAAPRLLPSRGLGSLGR